MLQMDFEYSRYNRENSEVIKFNRTIYQKTEQYYNRKLRVCVSLHLISFNYTLFKNTI